MWVPPARPCPRTFTASYDDTELILDACDGFIVLIREDSTQHSLDRLRHLNLVIVIFTRFWSWVMYFQEYSNSQEVFTQARGILAKNSESLVRISRRPVKRVHWRSQAVGRVDWVTKRRPVAFRASRGCIKLAAGAVPTSRCRRLLIPSRYCLGVSHLLTTSQA